jgi:hypothetical protein
VANTEQREYTSLAIKEPTRYKFEKWQAYLSKRWGFRATHDETLDYLIDEAGVPPEEDE